MQQVFLGLGSNTGDRLKNIIDALIFMQNSSCRIKKISNIYETEPVGPVVQSFFFISVV
jgi:7,8-dihydro-6-hydroxymethylpterin-pyrophosphokinase